MNWTPNYDKEPAIRVSESDSECSIGWPTIGQVLKRGLVSGKRTVIVAECYPGTDIEEVRAGLSELGAGTIISAERALKTAEELEELLAPWLGDDPVFGRMTAWELGSLFDAAKTAQVRSEIARAEGTILIFGTGAAYVAEHWNLLLYCDVTRWEIQQRQRVHRIGNIGADNASASPAELYKRAYFIDWRAADAERHRLHAAIDFYIDSNLAQRPAMISGSNYRKQWRRRRGVRSGLYRSLIQARGVESGCAGTSIYPRNRPTLPGVSIVCRRRTACGFDLATRSSRRRR